MENGKISCVPMREWLLQAIRARQERALGARPEHWVPSVQHEHSSTGPDALLLDRPGGEVLAEFRGRDALVNEMLAGLNDPSDTIARCTFELDLLEMHHLMTAPNGFQYCQEDSAPWPCPTVQGLTRAYRHRPGWDLEWDKLIAG